MRLVYRYTLLAAFMWLVTSCKENNNSDEPTIKANHFYSIVVDQNNTKWFATEVGLVSYDENKWVNHAHNPFILQEGTRHLALDYTANTESIWMSTDSGLNKVVLPASSSSSAQVFYKTTDNGLLSNKVIASISQGKSVNWIATSSGVNGLKNGEWLTNNYSNKFPGIFFMVNKPTAIGSSVTGDTCFLATDGAGVAVLVNGVDGISGATRYEPWGPMLIPSTTVYSVHVDMNGTQWYGTDEGVASHEGYAPLGGWELYTESEGLIDNHVQCIASDSQGILWFGTPSGVSRFDGSNCLNLTKEDGLPDNNVISIAIDKNGKTWFGTLHGLASYDGSVVTLHEIQ